MRCIRRLIVTVWRHEATELKYDVNMKFCHATSRLTASPDGVSIGRWDR